MSAKASEEVPDDKKEISDETSKRMCQHMNEDHAISVYVMAREVVSLKPGFKISGVRLKKVTLRGCEIQVVTCCNDLCEPLNVEYKFDPPLQSSAEARSRLVAIHQQLTKPKLSWFVTKPLVLIILPVWWFLIWASQIAGKEDIEKVASNISLLQFIDPSPEEQVRVFIIFLNFAFFLTFVAHFCEAVFVVDKANSIVKVSPGSMLMWVFCVAAAGFPFLTEYYELYKIGKAARDEKFEKLKRRKKG